MLDVARIGVAVSSKCWMWDKQISRHEGPDSTLCGHSALGAFGRIIWVYMPVAGRSCSPASRSDD